MEYRPKSEKYGGLFLPLATLLPELPKQSLKTLGKPFVIFLCSFGRTLQMMLSAASCFPGQMPFHQQAVDIVIGVPWDTGRSSNRTVKTARLFG